MITQRRSGEVKLQRKGTVVGLVTEKSAWQNIKCLSSMVVVVR